MSENQPLAAGAVAGWSIVASPSNIGPPTANFHSGVTCVSVSDCWAVGRHHNGTAYQTLIERWDGTSWAIVSSPNTSTSASNELKGVTCVSVSNCWAVGTYLLPGPNGSTYQTLIVRWNGTAWTIVNSPNVNGSANNFLSGVTCVSASECWAVGRYTGIAAGVGVAANVDQTLIERWDGTSWAIVISPNSSPSQGNDLSAVTCVSASDCWTVGTSYNGSNYQTLIGHWNGTSWAVVSSPNKIPSPVGNFLYGVTCVSASNCWAVGTYRNASAYQTLILRWDGTSWAIVSSPSTSTTKANFFRGVTCVSASDCWAVGTYASDSAYQTLIVRWDGTSWAIVSSPNTSTTQVNDLRGVTCKSASDCWTVGETLIEHWDGISWVIVSVPKTNSTLDSDLYGVTCVSAADCWAVGYSRVDNVNQTLIERWDGISWAIVSSPNTSATQGNFLFGVTCASASDCWALGYFSDVAQQTLIEHWDGTSWAIVSSPNTSTAKDNQVRGVTCVSASECWAVGYSRVGSTNQTLIERWDGTSWAIVSSPNTSTAQANDLRAVTCVSAADCWAVGYFIGNASQTLIEHWNGISWVIISSPAPGTGQFNFLLGVTCVSASDCWAVGYYYNGAVYQTLIEHWNGTSWAIVSSPNTDVTLQHYLWGVACVSASNCWAVGYYYNRVVQQTVIEHWDGTSWAIVTSPNTSTDQVNFLLAVTCVSGFDCWAVGLHGDPRDRTLTEHYTASAPPNLAPTARLTATPTSGAAPLPVNFDASTSSDPDSGDTIGSYTFNFGDGSAAVTQAGATVSHSYTSVGNYTATLTVSDNHGLQSANTASVPIQVTSSSPDPFTFIERSNVPVKSFVTSEAVTLTGYTGSLSISISAGSSQYSVNDAAFTNVAGSITAGAKLVVRHVSASAENTSVASTVTVGSYNTPFKSITTTIDRVPDVFDFGSKSGQAPGVVVESAAITPTAYDTASIVAGPDVEYRINGGSYTRANGTLTRGQTLQVRHSTNSAHLGYTKTYLKVGGVTGYFTTRTR